MTNLSKYKLTLSYDGTHYCGWQIQKNGIAIQMLLQNALTTILKTPMNATGAGRTDAGVHAMGQVAHFSHEASFDPNKLLLSLNGLLPPDIRILSIESVPQNFHARYSATRKTYRYYLHPKNKKSPFVRLYSTPVFHPLDIEFIKKGAAFFIGTHDFTSFSNESHRGSASRNAIRTIRRLDVVEQDEGLYLEFEANGFLYKMVRNIVGTLLDLSKGALSLEDLPAILNARDRKKAGKTAPPMGLFLVEVHY